MKILDKTRLIFSFYLTNENLYDEINQLHLKLLSKYINRFDDVIFCIIVNEDIDYNVIRELQKIVVNISYKNVMFKIYENTNYRESYVLYNEIVLKLNELDGLTFFAHNKGISDVFRVDNIKIWIAALYFFSFETELPSNYLNGPMMYGPFKSVGCNYKFKFAFQNKFDWTYCGTFFWLKCQEIASYIKFWNIKIPELTTRWYSELFLGNLVEEYEATTYNDKILDGEEIVGANIIDILERLYKDDEVLPYFKEYCNNNILLNEKYV